MKNAGEKILRHFLGFIFLMTGAVGILGALRYIFGGSVGFFVVPAIAVISYIIFLSAHRLKLFLLQIFILCTVLFITIHTKNSEAKKYAENIIYCMTSLKSFDNYDVSFFILMVGMLWAELGSFFNITLKKSGFYFLLITAFALACPYMGGNIKLYTIVLLLFSYTGLHILYNLGKMKNIVPLALFSLAVMGISLSLSYFTVDKFHNNIYDEADNIQGVIHRLVNDLIYSRGSDYDSGRVNAGNNYQSGKGAVEIWLSDKPTEPIYLKGFEGGDYTGNAWAEANEGDFFNQLSYEMGWNRWGNYMSAMYKEIYYNANNNSNTQAMRRSRLITINPLLPNVKNRYYPYMGRWEHITRKENIAYVYSYYELKDMDIRKDVLDAQSLRRFEYIQDTYEPYVYEHYLTLPSGMERLKALCEEQEFENIDEMTEFISSVLSQRTYTLKPGMAPLNKDIVDYFMFESKRGYCVHFASAAVLMYRMFGVPARYVTGYRANAGLFKQQDNGDYYFMATDRNAHAWAEIYIRDKGWVPIDFTPVSANITSERNNSGTEYTSISEQSTQSTETETDIANESQDTTAKSNKIYVFLPIAVAVLIIIRRRIKLKKRKCSDVPMIFKSLLDAIAIKDERYTGIERDFSEKLTKAIPTLKTEDAQKLIEIVYRQAYGNRKANSDERKFVFEMYKNCAEYMYTQSSILKRIYMKYIKCLC